MPLRELSSTASLADLSAEAVVIMAGIVRLDDRLRALPMDEDVRRDTGRQIASLKAQYFEVETLHRRLAAGSGCN